VILDGLTQRARSLIDESILTDSIVHAPWAEGLAAELLEASDDGAETPEAVEFWGGEEDGKHWRIHLIGSRT
jgi:hypothetical protein